MFILRPFPLGVRALFLARSPIPIIRPLVALLSSPALDVRLMTALQVLQVLHVLQGVRASGKQTFRWGTVVGNRTLSSSLHVCIQ